MMVGGAMGALTIADSDGSNPISMEAKANFLGRPGARTVNERTPEPERD